MSHFQHDGMCPKCNHPLRQGAKFCSGCGNPCSGGNAAHIHWSFILCCGLFGASLLYAWFWRDMYNWVVDLFKDYGSHIFWPKGSQVYDVVRAAIIAVCTLAVFHFESRHNKPIAIAAAALMIPSLLVTEIIYPIYITNTLGEFATILGMQTSVSPLIVLDIVYPALLICFILWNDRLGKYSIVFPAINLLCFLCLKRFDIFAAAASTLGLFKYWVRRGQTN